jgi:Glyoxalase-like domain
MRIAPIIALAFVTASLHAQAKRPAVGVDHVILGIDDLARGIEQFAALTGVTPKFGGVHPGRGTQNALVSLGDGHYLEILAPVTAGASDDPRTRYPDLTPAGWAIGTRDIQRVVAQMGSAGFHVQGPVPGSRRTPDSTLLQWRTASTTDLQASYAPFIIEWQASTTHPSRSSPNGCRLAALELSDPKPEQLRKYLRAIGYTTQVSVADKTAMRVTLDCPHGRITFPTQRTARAK